MKTTFFKSAILLATVFFMSSCDKESLVPISEVSQVSNTQAERANQGDLDFTNYENETDGRTFNGESLTGNNNDDFRNSDTSHEDFDNETPGQTHTGEGLSQSTNDHNTRQGDAQQDNYNNETDGKTHANTNLNQVSDKNDLASDEKQTHQKSKDATQFAGPAVIRDK